MSTVKCSAIKRLARLGRDPCALLIVVLAGLGAAHILVRTASYGAGISPDSSYLLSTALNFLAGEGWRDFTGYPTVGWPPLFPLLVALGGVVIDPLEAGRLVNAAAFGLTLLATGLYLRSNLRSQWLVLAATVALLASLPLSYLAGRFLTDPLFALLTLLALIQLAAFLHRGGRTPLLLSAIFTALAAITRYPGAALIGTGVLMLLPLARLKHTLVFGAISSVPLLTVLAHNRPASRPQTTLREPTHPTGQRARSPRGLDRVPHRTHTDLPQTALLFRRRAGDIRFARRPRRPRRPARRPPTVQFGQSRLPFR